MDKRRTLTQDVVWRKRVDGVGDDAGMDKFQNLIITTRFDDSVGKKRLHYVQDLRPQSVLHGPGACILDHE